MPSRTARGIRALASAAALLLGTAQGCGARTGTRERAIGPPLDGGGGISACLGDLDCGSLDRCAPIRCVSGTCVVLPRVACDDGDPCSVDRCVPETGACESRPTTRDEDGDGHRGPRAGLRAGSPGSCGDDCDDTSARAFPGGKEVCDGVDNDCNGVVDDGARYQGSGGAPLLLSAGADQASLGGIAFGSSGFGVAFAAKTASWANTFAAFEPSRGVTVPAVAVAHENTDSFTGPMVWTGSVFALAWADRRDQDFEIYFNRIDTAGKKLSPDVRVTNAPKFSLSPDLLWDGEEYVVVWNDRRGGDAAGVIFGQRIDADGNRVGDNVPLSPGGLDADGPAIAKGLTELGLVYSQQGPDGRQLAFRTVSRGLETLGTPVVLGDGHVASSAIVWSRDRYVVVWDTRTATPGPTIRGAAIAPDGTLLVQPRDVTRRAPFARSEALLPLGDRLLLAWASDVAGSYAIYSKTIGVDLTELSSEAQVVSGPSDSVGPAMAFGTSNGVGLAFEDRRSGTFQVYATNLECVAGN